MSCASNHGHCDPPITIHHVGPPLVRAHPDDAGVDLPAAEHATIWPREWKLIGTGIALGLRQGFVGLIHPRSGLAAKSGVTVLNAPGTIDAGYRGEIRVCLINHGNQRFVINPGDRIAQLLIQRVLPVTFEQLVFDGKPLEMKTSRGNAGFGSTGGHASLESAGE
ncbi:MULTISPECIES: dUTP diphosphatase [Nocardia]|uniref:dUTP diphosphatase n=1 Tax=Nocardia TaxID=1817 RepID=UPI000D69912B|nr:MULTISPECIES: dUTP diphosphatase [Nocardia]